MLSEERIKALALFFFYSALDERFAQQATINSYKKCQIRMKKGKLPQDKWPSVIVHVTNSYFEKLNRNKVKPAAISYEAGWLLKPGLDLGVWMEFQKESELDEFLSVIWSQVLKFSDEEISDGLGLTVGTVRHRVGRGLTKLGSVVRGGI